MSETFESIGETLISLGEAMVGMFQAFTDWIFSEDDGKDLK